MSQAILKGTIAESGFQQSTLDPSTGEGASLTVAREG